MTLDERIRECWDTLFVLNHELGMDGVFSLAHGANAETLAQAERDLGFALPEGVRAGCRFSNGVNWPWEGVCFAAVENIAESIVKYRSEVAECPSFRCAAGTKPPQFGENLVPFASYDLDDTAYCLDSDPGEGGKPGQVSAVCFADASVEVVAENYVGFLEYGIRLCQTKLDEKRARGGKPEKLPGEVGCLTMLGIGLLYAAGAVLVVLVGLLWRMLRLLIPRGPRERFEEKVRPWCRKKGVPYLVPSLPRPPKLRVEAAPGSIAALWYEIEDLNRARGVDVDKWFKAGASAKELAELEESLGFALPPDLRELLTACAACYGNWRGEDERYSGFDMDNIPTVLTEMKRILEPGYKLKLYPGTRYPRPGEKLIPIGSGNFLWPAVTVFSALCYDLDPGEGGIAGQIVDVTMEKHACRVVAPSLRAWLEGEIASLKQANPSKEPQDETMNIDTRVILNREKLPSRQAWQDAIRAHGFELEMETDFDPATFSGFLPCRYRGVQGGFQYSIRPLERNRYNEVELRDIGGRGHVVTFGVPMGTGLESMGCASIASAVLCEMTDGLLSDVGNFTAAKDAIPKARKGLDGMRQLQKMADFAQKEGIPEHGADSQEWMDKLKANTGITLPLIPFRVPTEQREAPVPVPKVRVAAAPGSLAALWYEIEDLNRARGVDVDEKFARGSNEEELRYFEGRIGHFIPDDLRELFLACSGFEDPWPCEGREPIYVDLTFVLWGIQDETLALANGENGTQAVICNRNLITLEARGSFLEAAEGPCLCYDRTPGAAGRIVEVECGKGTYRVVAPSLRAWLEEGLMKLRVSAGEGNG